MKTLISITATAALLLGGATTVLAQSVLFEAKGFPITLSQAQVMGLNDIQEQLPDLTLTRDGMPASPNQLAVLKPRTRMNQQQVVEMLTAAGYSKVNFEAPAEYHVLATKNGALVSFFVNSTTGVTH